MSKNDNKSNFSYFESKYVNNKEKEGNQNVIIKRNDKRHKTEIGITPKNFQILINNSQLAKENFENGEFKYKKYNTNTVNIDKYSRKNKSTIALPSFQKYNLNTNTNIIDNNRNDKNNKNLEKKSQFKKSKTQIVDKSNLINNFRHNPKFHNYERRMSDKFLSNDEKNKKEEKPHEQKPKEKKPKEEMEIENNKQNSSSRRRSIGTGMRRFCKQESKANKEFTKITYVKLSKATSEAGLDDGVKKINQDSYIHEKNVKGILNFNIFGVLDGHGDFGHFASKFVKRYIINRISNHPNLKNLDNPKDIYKVLIKNNYEIITNIFLDADMQIKKEKFDCEMSGTTCVIVIQLDDNIICANTGDSRAIIVYDENPNDNLKSTKVYPLSYDAKPDKPGEKERIIKCGGEVEKMVDENNVGVGPFRVWAKGKSYPGLSMSRSIGDMDAKNVGVIPNPEFVEYKIDSRTKYMIVCSDGIWEFISNEDVMKIANSYYQRNDALGLCQTLTNKSRDFWLKEDNYVDDITVVTVFF